MLMEKNEYSKLIDEHLIFIDPAELTAIELYKHLLNKKLLLEKMKSHLFLLTNFIFLYPTKTIQMCN